MSRVLKFRAWNKEESRLIDLNGFEIAFKGMQKEGEVNAAIEQGNIYMYDTADVEIMQFTGLTDKNGVEIYEGDVSPYLECSRQGKINAQVYYCTETAQFRVKWIDGGVENFDSLDDCAKWFEVIGNIHQNPELLK